jgi:hypothetical protein
MDALNPIIVASLMANPSPGSGGQLEPSTAIALGLIGLMMSCTVGLCFGKRTMAAVSVMAAVAVPAFKAAM